MGEFTCSHYCISGTSYPIYLNTLYSFPLSLHILGKHASVKDEDEAMAGAADRIELDLGSALGGQGKRLMSSCNKLELVHVNGIY